MTELKPRIHDESNGLDYVLVGDYYVPDLKLPEEHRPIGMWGRLHRTYLEQYRPTRFSALCLSGELHTYLADLNEQAADTPHMERFLFCVKILPPQCADLTPAQACGQFRQEQFIAAPLWPGSVTAGFPPVSGPSFLWAWQREACNQPQDFGRSGFPP